MSKKNVNKRSRKYRRRRRRRIIFGIEIFVLVLLGVGLFGYMWLNNVMNRMQTQDLDPTKVEVNSEVQQNIEAMSGSQIIAVAGLDGRGAAMDGKDDPDDRGAYSTEKVLQDDRREDFLPYCKRWRDEKDPGL